MIKKSLAVVAFLICLLTQTACEDGVYPLSRTEYALGTIINITVYKTSDSFKNAEETLNKAFDRLLEIEKITSAKLSVSELSYVNANAFKRETPVSDELFTLLETGLDFSEITGGAFDITLGRLADLWGIGTDEARVPSEEEIEEAKSLCGYENLVLNSERKTVRFLKDIRLDLGAAAKGYAADEIKRILKDNNVTEAVLDLGGNIMLVGDKSGEGYRVGITDPRDTANFCGVLLLKDIGAVTSGDYERYFTDEITGKRYHHIFDRSTGYPAESGFISVTVVFDNSMTADMLSTAFFAGGTELFAELAAVNPVLGAVFVTENGEKIVTEGLKKYFEE